MQGQRTAVGSCEHTVPGLMVKYYAHVPGWPQIQPVLLSGPAVKSSLFSFLVFKEGLIWKEFTLKPDFVLYS